MTKGRANAMATPVVLTFTVFIDCAGAANRLKRRATVIFAPVLSGALIVAVTTDGRIQRTEAGSGSADSSDAKSKDNCNEFHVDEELDEQ
jgi:hypothetical protein